MSNTNTWSNFEVGKHHPKGISSGTKLASYKAYISSTTSLLSLNQAMFFWSINRKPNWIPNISIRILMKPGQINWNLIRIRTINISHHHGTAYKWLILLRRSVILAVAMHMHYASTKITRPFTTVHDITRY